MLFTHLLFPLWRITGLNALCPVNALYIARTSAFKRAITSSFPGLHHIWRMPFLNNTSLVGLWKRYSWHMNFSPQGALKLRGHSTRGMAASWALLRGISLQNNCDGASCALTLSFVRYRRLDVTWTLVAQSVARVGST